MKKIPVKKLLNDNANDLVMGVLDTVPEMRLVSRIGDALDARGMTQSKLATITGLRNGTISELVNGTRLALTKTHIACVMIALRITDIREIIDIEFSQETKDQFKLESDRWINEDIIPDIVTKLYSDHAKALFKPDIR